MTDYSKLSNKEKHKVSIFDTWNAIVSQHLSFVLLWILKQTSNRMSPSSTVEKTSGGKDAARSHQQLHRAAQIHAGEAIPAAGSKHQAGESRHPGDDRGFSESSSCSPRPRLHRKPTLTAIPSVGGRPWASYLETPRWTLYVSIWTNAKKTRDRLKTSLTCLQLPISPPSWSRNHVLTDRSGDPGRRWKTFTEKLDGGFTISYVVGDASFSMLISFEGNGKGFHNVKVKFSTGDFIIIRGLL